MEYRSLTNYILNQTFGKGDHSDLSVEQVRNAIADFRFWLRVETYEPLTPWLPIMTNTGNFAWAECRIATEADGYTSPYELLGESEYKCYAIPIDPNSKASRYCQYTDDLLSSFRDGSAIQYTPGDFVEHLIVPRPITNKLFEYFDLDIISNESTCN